MLAPTSAVGIPAIIMLVNVEPQHEQEVESATEMDLIRAYLPCLCCCTLMFSWLAEKRADRRLFVFNFDSSAVPSCHVLETMAV